MKRLTVDSEAISSVGYDISRQVLEIEFNSGEVYTYYNVPERVYENLLAAESHGRYFQDHIREQFDFNKVE